MDVTISKKSLPETTFDVVFSFGSDPNWTCSTASHSPQHVFDTDGLFLSPEAPAIRLVVASRAASIFSRTISSASHRAILPPRISFIIRSAITPFASAASIIKEVNIRRSVRRGLKKGTLYISPRLSVLLSIHR